MIPDDGLCGQEKKERMTEMKKWFALLLILLLASVPFAQAESTREYRDDIYAFRYPASWSCDTAANGDIVLLSPDGGSAVLTFAVVNDLIQFIGDEKADAPAINTYISQYGGKNLALTGEYTLIQSGALKGFRAPGSWRATGQDAVMLVLTGERHMVGFVLVGKDALALEQAFLDSVRLLGDEPEESEGGFLRWDSAKIALDYPKHFGALEQATGVAFINPDDPNCIIMARLYTLDVAFSDAIATQVAVTALPKSTKVEPNAELVQIGGRSAAVIKGAVSGGPMEFYVIGSGRSVVALMFTGEEACGIAEHVIQSVEIK